MPQLIGQLLKAQCAQFLTDNDVKFEERASRDDLRTLVRSVLEEHGIDPEYYDFSTNRVLHVNNLPLSASAVQSSRRSSLDLPPPDRFSLEPVSTSASRWESWCKSFQYFMSASYPNEANVATKRAIFLHVAGPEVQSLLESLEEDDSITDEFGRAKNALDMYFKPRKNKRYQRFLFTQISQGSDESLDAFLSRLRHQARQCEFSDIDDRLLDQLILHCKNSAFRKKLLLEGETLSLTKALEIGRTFESAEKQTAVMDRAASCYVETPVSSVAQRGKVSLSGQRKCKFCSSYHEFRKECCPARNSTCRACGKCGHYSNAEVCSKTRNQGSGFSFRGRARGRNRFVPSRTVRSVDSTDPSRSNVEYSLPVSECTESDVPYIATLSCPPFSRSSAYTQLDVSGIGRTRFLLDTGSQVSILPRNLLPSNVDLQPSANMYLLAYDGSRIPTIGKVVRRVVNPRNGRRYDVAFVVVQEGSPLLSLNAILKMELMSLSEKNILRLSLPMHSSSLKTGSTQQVHDQSREKWDCLLEKYSDLFGTDLGKLQGVKVHIHLREGAKPVFMRARPVPFALQKKVEEALDLALAQGTLEKVSSSDWASPTVNIPKPNGDIRICSDFKATVNPQIQVDQHPLPSAEDLFAQLSGSHVYARLDFSRMFEQFEVHEDSPFPFVFPPSVTISYHTAGQSLTNSA